MALLQDAMPIAWPSLSDLAREMRVGRSTISRMSAIRKRRGPKIGREVKVPPDTAVAVMVARGFTREIAVAAVHRIVDQYLAGLPSTVPAVQGAPALAVTSLTRSNIGRSHLAQLTPARMPSPVADTDQLAEMSSAERLAFLDRMLGGRTVPIEQYIDQNR
jgi:hypothetical protein